VGIESAGEWLRENGVSSVLDIRLTMNEPQILNLMIASLPTVLKVLIGILSNNTRLSDLRTDMNTRF
jgi:hypothetical protein